MRPDSCVSCASVSLATSPNSRTQVLALRPARLVPEADLKPYDGLTNALEFRAQSREIGPSLAVQRLSGEREFAIPSVQNPIRPPIPKNGVPLQQCAAKSAPAAQVLMFHVEHPPIEQPAASLRGALHQTPDIGMDCLHR